MNFDIQAMTNQYEHDTKAARVERKRVINEALGERTRSRLAMWAGAKLSRAGERLQGLPQAAMPDMVVEPGTSRAPA